MDEFEYDTLNDNERFMEERSRMFDHFESSADDLLKRIAELEAQNAALLEFVRKTAELNSRESFNINWYGTRARALLAELDAKEGDE
jgi:hypothetical protein